MAISSLVLQDGSGNVIGDPIWLVTSDVVGAVLPQDLAEAMGLPAVDGLQYVIQTHDDPDPATPGVVPPPVAVADPVLLPQGPQGN
jgi:hypothetical protein